MSDLDALEARVQSDRDALAASLASLSGALSPQALSDDVKETITGRSGEIGQQAIAAAKRNPLASGLLGAGLILALTGTGRGSRQNSDTLQPSTASAGKAPPSASGEPAADTAGRARRTGAPSAEHLRANINRNLGDLPPKSRARVLAARQAAIAAQEKLEARSTKRKTTMPRIYETHPLGAAAVAFGVGAIAAALLPKKRREDEHPTAHRDACMAEARRAMSEERTKLRTAGYQPNHVANDNT